MSRITVTFKPGQPIFCIGETVRVRQDTKQERTRLVECCFESIIDVEWLPGSRGVRVRYNGTQKLIERGTARPSLKIVE